MVGVQEEWRGVVGFDDSYEVSNLGAVRSKTRVIVDSKSTRIFKGKILQAGVQSNDYLGVHLYKGSKSTSRLVHYLVAEAFLGTRPDGMDVDHIDSNRANNSLSNLRYIPIKENRGRPKNPVRKSPSKKGKSNKLTAEQVIHLRQERANGINLSQYATRWNVSLSTIHHAASGRSWKNV